MDIFFAIDIRAWFATSSKNQINDDILVCLFISSLFTKQQEMVVTLTF